MSSAYVVLDEVWHLLGRHATEDKCSWLNIPALKRREISEIVRTQSGTYPKFPCELDVLGSVKKLPGVKDAQITLLDFAQTEVVKFMRSNARTVRLSGSVFSRTLKMQHDLAAFLEDNPQASEIPLDWVLEFVDKLVCATRGTFTTSIYTQTVLCLSVSHRLEKAMKVDHLTTTNPLKTEREDLIPPIAMRRIEDAAKRNLDLSWALDQTREKTLYPAAAPKIPHGAGRRTSLDSVAEVAGPARAASARAARAAIGKAAEAAVAAPGRPHVPSLGRTPGPPSKRPHWASRLSGCPQGITPAWRVATA